MPLRHHVALVLVSAFVFAVPLSSQPKFINLQAADPAAPGAKVELPPATAISQDTVLDPQKTYGRLVIKASNITIDGAGAKLVGAKSGNPKTFQGIGIFAEGVSNVVIKNVRVQGFETGLKVVNGEGWLMEGCDFSDNFHDPEFGWGEQGRRGGIVLERVRKSTVTKCKANKVWDACSLVESDDNTLTENDFSHTSNTCLKLWTSCRNTVTKNVLSHGIRIAPKEVHARDSTCVLIESGSNDNRLINNNCRQGGDGIFVRVLNGWVSTGNHFEGNDCSYANNNGVECWAPRNVFVKNKANHCSYGFWMGGSDQSRLIGNEANFNGDPKGTHNSPHLPDAGHAGIVFMFGPSSHIVARGNVCKNNNGAGIAVIGDIDSKGKKWKAYHWIIEQNVLTDNRYGIYLQYADWIQIGINELSGNSEKEIRDDGGVTRLTSSVADRELFGFEEGGYRSGPLKAIPKTVLFEGPQSSIVGNDVVFDARINLTAKGPENFAWDLGDGTVTAEPTVKHRYTAPGFYRVGLSLSRNGVSDLAWRDFYVVEDLPELATEGQAAEWSLVEEPNLQITYQDVGDKKIAGKSALYAKINPYHGQRASLLFPKSKAANWMLAGKTHLVFWVKTINPNLGWQDVNPVITLYGADAKSLRLSPKQDLLGKPTYNEGREGWNYFEIPLAGDDTWQREGTDIPVLNYFTIGVDSWDAQPLQLWIDGLAFKTKQ